MTAILDETGSSDILDESGTGILDETTAPPAVFPDIPLDVRIEVDAGGTWTVLSGRLDHGPVTISRGHPDESTTVAPSTVDFELTNTDGALSPDNPQGALYPWLVQNIPGRVSIPEGASYLRCEVDRLSGAFSGSTVTPPANLDAQCDITLDSGWTQGAMLAGQWISAGNDRHWFLALNNDGTLQLGLSSDGTMGTFQGAASTLPVTAPPSGRLSVRVTYAPGPGSAIFYTSTTALSASPSWVQLGATVTLSSAGPHATAAFIELGFSEATDFAGAYFPYPAPWMAGIEEYPGIYGRYHGFKLVNSATTAVLASPDFTVQAAGASGWTDSAGVVWGPLGTAEVSDRDYQAYAELTEWPQDEPPVNPKGGVLDATVKVTGGGLLRRLSQKNNPVSSAWARGCLKVLAVTPGLAAAWAMEDLAGSASLASLTGGPAMTWTGSPTLGSSPAFAGSNPLPVVNQAQFTGRVAPYKPGWTDNVCRFLMDLPAGETSGAVIASMRTSGTAARADLTYNGSGAVGLSLYNATGALIASTSSLTPFDASGVIGRPCRMSIELIASGSNVIYVLEITRPDGSGASTSGSASTAGSIGAVLEVALNPGGLLLGTVLGGVTVQPLFTPAGDMTGPLAGWSGEPAGWRVSRLCSEEGIPFRGRGNLAATVLMGVQVPDTLVSLMQGCATADRGTWTELKQALGWGYVTRAAMYNQAPAVSLDYSLDHLSVWLSPPTRDDEYIANDITVTNANGSSARQFAAPGQPVPGGRLSTLAPGTGGVGSYDGGAFSVAVARDSDLPSLASWAVHLGTVDQARFPGVAIDLSNRALASQMSAVLAMDLAQRLVIADAPLRWGPATVSQLAAQLSVTLGAYDLEVNVCGIPELPYEVFQLGTSRIDTDGTQLQSGVSSPALSESWQATGSGYPLWSTLAGDYPLNVMQGGEVAQVALVSSSSSPQTAAMGSRSVNGVVKAQTAGTAVNVWPSPVIAL